MKVICVKEHLLNGLDIVGKAIDEKSVVPLTNMVYIQATPAGLKMTATNAETTIACEVPATVTELGETCVVYKALREYATVISADRFEINVGLDNVFKISGAKHRSTVATAPVKDFPPFPEISETSTIDFAANDLKDAITKVEKSASIGNQRPILTAVNCTAKSNLLTLAAADGFRLAVYEMATSFPGGLKMNLPCKYLSELVKLCDPTDTVRLSIDNVRSKVKFQVSSIGYVIPQLLGVYPEYWMLIPDTAQTKITVMSAGLKQAVDATMVFVKDYGGEVKLICEKGVLKVIGATKDLGDNFSEVDCKQEGPDARVAANGKYIIEALENFKEKCQLTINGSSKPFMLREEGNNSYTQVIMPLAVKW